MVLGIIDMLLLAGAAYFGLKMFNSPPPKRIVMPRPRLANHLPMPIHYSTGAGGMVFVQNASPYAYEPDGNLL
jgi:hypothetical protein